ncbi:MAG: TetR/AcrR family transcriptional regulator [Planctomycetota bacterium]|nr:TetR/AcrR family transcriptional regulator [Planctomycetota bacterium]
MQLLSRKQREIQQRESQILSLARPILVSEGYQSLSMDRLATQMEYAKGTLYNHFPNKEEIVAALAIESLEMRREMFERASVLVQGSRLRMTAIGCACDVYASQCAEHFAVEQMLRNMVIWEKSSAKRQKIIQQCELRCMGVVAGVVRDAIAAGELKLPAKLSAEEFVFGFWSLTFGSHILMATSPSLPDVGVQDPVRSIRFHGWTMMNGYGWNPSVSFEETEAVMEELAPKILQAESEECEL